MSTQGWYWGRGAALNIQEWVDRYVDDDPTDGVLDWISQALKNAEAGTLAVLDGDAAEAQALASDLAELLDDADIKGTFARRVVIRLLRAVSMAVSDQ